MIDLRKGDSITSRFFLAKNGNIIFTTKIALKFHSSQTLCSKQLYYIYFLKMVKW